VLDLDINPKYLVLSAIGERMALLTWLEFPDYNIRLKSG
jgi:hypothetical protein